MLKYFKNFALFIFLIAFFLVSKNVSAADVVIEDQMTRTNNWYVSSLMQSFSTTVSNISKIRVYATNGGDPSFSIGYLCAGDPSTSLGSDVQYDCTNGDDYAVASAVPSNTGSYSELVFTPPAEIVAGVGYYFTFAGNSGSWPLDFAQGNPYSYGESWITGYQADYDTKFEIYYDDDYTPAPTSSDSNKVYPEYPYNTQTDVSSPVFFTGTYTNDGTFDQMRISIFSRDTAGSEGVFLKSIDSDISIGSSINYADSSLLDAGNYSYRAYMFNDEQTATSSDQYEGNLFFSVVQLDGSPTPLITPYFSATSTANASTKALVYCDTTATSTPDSAYGWLSKWITDGFRDTICFLFIPNQGFLQSLGDSSAAIKTRAPFGYVGLVGSSLTAIATSSVATTSPAGFTNSDYAVVGLLSSFGLFTSIRLILSYLMVIVALIYVIQRIRMLIST